MIDHYAVINRRYAISISHKERLRSVGLDNIKRMAEATARGCILAGYNGTAIIWDIGIFVYVQGAQEYFM